VKKEKEKKKRVYQPANLIPKNHTKVTDEDLRPDELEDLLVDGSEPYKALMTAAKQCGLDEKVTVRMIERIKAEFQPVLGELREVKTQELRKLLDDRAHRALVHMDDKALEQASAKDLAIIAGIMLEKRALLRGEPTQIVSVDDRQNMQELLPALLQEAQKRGMFVDVIEGEVTVTPGDPEREYRPRTKMSLADHGRKAVQKKKDEIGDPS